MHAPEGAELVSAQLRDLGLFEDTSSIPMRRLTDEQLGRQTARWSRRSPISTGATGPERADLRACGRRLDERDFDELRKPPRLQR